MNITLLKNIAFSDMPWFSSNSKGSTLSEGSSQGLSGNHAGTQNKGDISQEAVPTVKTKYDAKADVNIQAPGAGNKLG